jgi:predicted nucleic acid-binding protein
MLRAGDLRVCDLDPQAAEYLESFVLRYPTSDLTDASLMYLAERDSRDAVLTLDRRDFLVYRTTDGRALELLP